MLFQTNVSRWVGVGRGSHVVDHRIGQDYVFNIFNVSNLKEEGAGSKFNYLSSPVFRHTGYDEIHCDTPYLTIKQEYDIAPTTKTLALTVFPDNNLGKPTFQTYISIYDFSYAWAHNPYPQYTWLVYNVKGSTAKRILVNMTLDEIVALDNPFSALNVQWFVFCDPLEEIHPTWYIRV